MEQFLTTQEAAQHANVTVSTINRWCKLGYLGQFGNVGTGSGNGYQIPRTKFDEFLNSHKKWSKKRYDLKLEAKKEPTKVDKKKRYPGPIIENCSKQFANCDQLCRGGIEKDRGPSKGRGIASPFYIHYNGDLSKT